MKTKRWEDRLQKKLKDASIKKLEAELREEKTAELRRRREITQDRKRAAEERQRLEEDKVKVRLLLSPLLDRLLQITVLFLQVGCQESRPSSEKGRQNKENKPLNTHVLR